MAKILNVALACIAFVVILGVPALLLAAEPEQSTPTSLNYSVREIKGMFPRPKNVEKLLRNMKLAYDRNPLVQPTFFDDAVLKEFFNGTAISWSNSGQVVKLDERIFPGMTIRVHHTNIPMAEHNAAEPLRNHVQAHSESHNYLEVETGTIVVITVRHVKNVFGDEFKEQIDTGFDTDGHSHVPTTKGFLEYSDSLRGPGPEQFNNRGALFVVMKDLAAPRCVPANQPSNHCGFGDDDVIERMSLSGSASVFAPAT
jgi:hypothetical protein